MLSTILYIWTGRQSFNQREIWNQGCWFSEKVLKWRKKINFGSSKIDSSVNSVKYFVALKPFRWTMGCVKYWRRLFVYSCYSCKYSCNRTRTRLAKAFNRQPKECCSNHDWKKRGVNKIIVGILNHIFENQNFTLISKILWYPHLCLHLRDSNICHFSRLSGFLLLGVKSSQTWLSANSD